MDYEINQTNEKTGFVFLPATSGKGVIVKKSEVIGARPNGPNEGAVVYTQAGPCLYTSLSTSELAQLFHAEPVQQQA